MAQLSKKIYFSDYPAAGNTKSGLTVSFPAGDEHLHAAIKHLSSHSIRRLIGYERYSDIINAANEAGSQAATYVRSILKNRVRANQSGESAFFRIQSTFKGGRGSPLHDWYPYLEGYSPEFVNNVIETFAPHARDILDPFCGSGTTALVAASRGGIGYYTEVNPVCQYVIAQKSLALTLGSKARARIARELHAIADRIDSAIRSASPDKELEASFHTTFGPRPFFDARTFEYVLRARSLADRYERIDPVIGRFVTLAALRSIVPCSLLVRRGDLRFRTAKELERGLPNFIDELAESLNLIASDLIDSEAAPGRTLFLTDDARQVSTFISNKVDAVITSPPYLNGTNYFRNTKIELWFLRRLKSKTDLRKFRDLAVTSGINDVTRGKLLSARRLENRFTSALLEDTLKRLGDNAYDQRIPAMVENYFYDMHDVLASVPTVLKEGGILAIDLGDSVYSGVHVPTQNILTEMLKESGFRLETTVTLRERQSRDGTPLRQTLQIFSLSNGMASHCFEAESRTSYPKGWRRFKEGLPHQSGVMARRNWGHPWHSMCSYQGKLKPAIARCLVDAVMPQTSGKLLDVFSGVGTIPFEARMRGHTAFGFDISPAAVAISRAKLERVDWLAVEDIIFSLEARIADNRIQPSTKGLSAIRFNGPLESYFHEATLREILVAREYFTENPPASGASALVLSCLLHILHGNRPYALSRRSHPITPFSPSGPTEYRCLLDRLKSKVERCKAAAAEVPNIYGRSYFQDATEPWPAEVNNLDAIITSPPFFDSTRFHTANWMRLWFAGWEVDDFSRRPAEFVEERQKKNFSIYEDIFRQASERLKPGGYFAAHVGKSTKCDMAAALQQIGEQFLVFSDWFSESVEHCESHGIRDKGTVTHHQYLLFKKPRDTM